MDPCTSDPSIRRRPFGVMYRAVHTLHMPVSLRKTASSAATSSRMLAAYSGWIGRSFSAFVVYAPTTCSTFLSCSFRSFSRNLRFVFRWTSGSTARIVESASPWIAMSTSVRRPRRSGAMSICAVRTSLPGRNWS